MVLVFQAPPPRVNVPTEARFVEIVVALEPSISPEHAAALYSELQFRDPVKAVAAALHSRRTGTHLIRQDLVEWLEPRDP